MTAKVIWNPERWAAENEAIELVRQARVGGRVVVFTNGVFDILHPGHTRYLRDARALGRKIGEACTRVTAADSGIPKQQTTGRPKSTAR